MAVKKWEDYGNKATNMDLNIEKILRLYILDNVVIPERQTSKFREKYRQVTRMVSQGASTEALYVSL